MQQPKGKCLLVTGGAGFIGSNFVGMALERGHTVVVLDIFSYAGHRENLAGVAQSPQLHVVQGNISDFQLVSELLRQHRVDQVVNFAAESHVDRSIAGPSPFIDTNIGGTFQLLNASLKYWRDLDAVQKKIFRYLQISTDEVYGSLGATGKFSESTPYAPNSPYSASKAAADHLVRAWHHTYDLPTLTTNCSNNYGPRQFPEKLIPTMITQALASKPLPVYGDGGNVRDWIHVEDHCAGIFLALEHGTPGQTYCFGGNAERNNLQVVQTICRQLDTIRPRADGKLHETGIAFVTDRLGHDRRYAIDDTLAEKELGFKRKYAFDTGLADTVRWYIENTRWSETVLKKV